MTYTNPKPGEPCVLDIGGRKLELRFTLKALRQLDTEHQISVLKGEGLGSIMQDPARLAQVLFYGLRSKNPDITEDWIEENVDASMLLEMSPMLIRAITGRWFDLENFMAKQSPNGASPAGTSTGSPSGQLPATTSDVVN